MTLTLDLNLPRLSHHRVHYTAASADFSHCGHYRYRLKRRWVQGPALMCTLSAKPGVAYLRSDRSFGVLSGVDGQ